MKFTVNCDCTPEEARAFLGLPDLRPIHDQYVKTVTEAMSGVTSVEQMERIFRDLSPIGSASMKLFSDMMDIGLGAAGGGKKSG